MIASMLFGMFFGAGNMIFPAALGVAAGNNILYAFGGMFLTAVGLPLLAVAALGITRTGSVLEIGAKVSRKFGFLFSLLLYLTIGPLFAVPRCASTSFAIGAVSLGDGFDPAVALAVFSLLFFAAVFVFSRHPGRLMTWIGKYLNPLFPPIAVLPDRRGPAPAGFSAGGSGALGEIPPGRLCFCRRLPRGLQYP